MTPDEIKAVRKMDMSELRAKASGLGIAVQPEWGAPKLISVILKSGQGLPVSAPQGAPLVVADGVPDVVVTEPAPEAETPPAATQADKQAEASMSLMQRQTELMHQQHARITGLAEKPATTIEALPVKPRAPAPHITGHGSMLMSDDELQDVVHNWASAFVVDFQSAAVERSTDTLTLILTSRHGDTKVSAGGVVFTPSGVKEALAHLRRQAEGESN